MGLHICYELSLAARTSEADACDVLLGLREEALGLPLECVVRDETGYWDSRDQTELITRVDEMNRIVARIAGTFSDKFVEAGGEARQVDGEIFHHPDFERLETEE